MRGPCAFLPCITFLSCFPHWSWQEAGLLLLSNLAGVAQDTAPLVPLLEVAQAALKTHARVATLQEIGLGLLASLARTDAHSVRAAATTSRHSTPSSCFPVSP